MAFGAFKLQRGGSAVKGAYPKKTPVEVSAHVFTTCCASLLFTSGPTAHWVGPEILVGLWVEVREIDALSNSHSQVIL